MTRARTRTALPRLAFAAAAAALLASPARGGDLSPSVPHFNPSFPVFGGGKFVNIFESDGALTNASAHVAWALAIPFAGESIGGRKGKWIAGLSWIGLTLLQESLFHAPPNPGPGYPAEVRADLVSRLVPTMLVLGWDLVHGGHAPARAIDADPPRPPLRAGLTGADAARSTPAEGAPVRAAGPAGMCPDAPQPARRAAEAPSPRA